MHCCIRSRSGYREGCTGRGRSLPDLAGHLWHEAPGDSPCHCRCHRGSFRRDCFGRIIGYRTADPLYGQGGAARRGEFPLLCGPRPWRCGRVVAAGRRPSQLHHASADRSGGGHHAVEHPVHAVHLEDRACARSGLHCRPQAGRVESALGGGPDRDHGHGHSRAWRSGWRRKSHSRTRGERGEGADRARRHQGRCLRRRNHNGLAHHAARRCDIEARPLRAGWKEPGHRIR